MAFVVRNISSCDCSSTGAAEGGIKSHSVLKTELEGTYTARVCRGIKVLLVAAGYAGDLHSSH